MRRQYRRAVSNRVSHSPLVPRDSPLRWHNLRDGPPMIRAEGLGKRFGRRWAARDLTLEVARGEVFGFLGPNGAGKTTTVRMLAGMIAPTEGRAWIGGAEVARATDDLRARIGLLTEAPGLYERQTARQNLDLHAKLQGLPRPRRDEDRKSTR